MNKLITLFGIFLLSFFSLFNLALAKDKEIKIGTQAIFSAQSLAIAKGYFAEEFEKLGLKVQIINADTGRDINNGLASKSIDFGFLGTTPFVVANQRGLETQTFYVDFFYRDNEAIVIKKGSDIKSIADLKGKKIAVPLGTSAHYLLHNALKLHGLTLDDAFTREKMQILIKEIYQKYNKTVVFITHDIDEALLLANRIIILKAFDKNTETNIAYQVSIPNYLPPDAHFGLKQQLLDIIRTN